MRSAEQSHGALPMAMALAQHQHRHRRGEIAEQSCHYPTARSMGGWPVPVLSRAADPAAEVDIDGWFKSDSEWGQDRMALT